MNDIETMCIRAELLCRMLAPKDLGSTPLYIIEQSILPDELGGKGICYGFTSPCLDLYLKDVIGSAWHGRGGCMVINDTQFDSEMDVDDIEQAFVALVLHELAHILQRPAIYRDREGENDGRLKFEAIAVGYDVSQELPPEAEDLSLAFHVIDFIRIVLHLCHRVKMLGVAMSPWQICNTRLYGLSHPNGYRDALGDEPRHLANASFKEIRVIPYPEEFSRLWANDVARRQKIVSTP
jgi:hypothetical protein